MLLLGHMNEQVVAEWLIRRTSDTMKVKSCIQICNVLIICFQIKDLLACSIALLIFFRTYSKLSHEYRKSKVKECMHPLKNTYLINKLRIISVTLTQLYTRKIKKEQIKHYCYWETQSAKCWLELSVVTLIVVIVTRGTRV